MNFKFLIIICLLLLSVRKNEINAILITRMSESISDSVSDIVKQVNNLEISVAKVETKLNM